MARYTLRVRGEELTVEAGRLDEALWLAGIDPGDPFEVVEVDDFEEKCLLFAITDDILFGD